MPERPLLILPAAVEIVRPNAPKFVPPGMQRPSGARQRRRLEERYQHLWRALNDGGLMQLRRDPASIAPDRAIVFEIAGNVANFYKAVRKIPGLSFVAEDEFDFAPDEDFAMLDDEQLPDADTPVEGRMYLALPTEAALEEILRLYGLWQRGEKLDRGFTPWRDVFSNLKDMRPWGPQDRIPDDAIELWREEIADAGITEVRVEAELFYQENAMDRAAALASLEEAAEELDGEVITSSVIPGIQYHAALVSLPPQGVRQLMEREPVELVVADQVMFLRPQSSFRGPAMDVGAPQGRDVPRLAVAQDLPPIAALLDGFPLQNHHALDGRLRVDDPDGLEPQAVVARRHHGTAMASLILHGDLIGFLRDNQANRTLYAPAEGLNPLTIGAAHDDAVPAGFPHRNNIAPFAGEGFPNVTSALGLGHHRVIKPDLILAGGKERLQFRASNPLMLRSSPPQGSGLRVAAPDPSGRGDLTRRSLMCGTSVANALASRASHQIFDSMMDADGGSNLAEVEAAFWPVMVKTLLVHSARWPQSAATIASVFGPAEPHRWAERANNVARLIGYGVPNIVRVMECSPSQATLVGYGAVTATVAHEYHIPLPECLERVTDPRSIIITLGWLSPVSNNHLDYRRAQLMVDAPGHREQIGVHRETARQPSEHAKKRGSIIHEVFSGEEAVVFVQDGDLVLRVWCREKPTGAKLDAPIRYALAVTIEAGTPLPVYAQTSVRLRQIVVP